MSGRIVILSLIQFPYHPCIWYIYTYIWLIFMVNVGREIYHTWMLWDWTTIQLKKIWTKLQNQSPAAILDIAPLRKGEKSSIVQGAFKEHFLRAIVGCYMQGCRGQYIYIYIHILLQPKVTLFWESPSKIIIIHLPCLMPPTWVMIPDISCDCWKTNCSPWNWGSPGIRTHQFLIWKCSCRLETWNQENT